MSKDLSAAAVQEFSDLVHDQYQNIGVLKPTVEVRSGVIGDAYKFVRRDFKAAIPRGAFQSNVTPLDLGYFRPVATLQDWMAPEYTDIFEQAEVNFDERQSLVKSLAMALGRREDQLIIDALTNSGTTNIIPTAATNLTVDKLRETNAIFQKIGVPENEKHIAVSPEGLKSLLKDQEVTNIFYNDVRALVDGTVKNFLGLNFHIIGDRQEGGLPLTGTVRTAFAWHKMSTGLAIGIDKRVEINYIAEKVSWLTNGVLKAGAVAIDPTGIISLSYDESL